MKKPLVLLICILLALCIGCAPKEPEQSVFAIEPLESAAPQTPDAELNGPAVANMPEVAVQTEASPAATDPEAPPAPAVTVTDTAAYVFSGLEGATLYGAAAYENTGNCPVIITGASFAFTVGGTTVPREFTPVMNDKTVVLPGETSFVACWHADSSLAADASASLAVTLSCAQAESARINVAAKDVYLADNYPGFTTMTGSLTADSPCSLNLVYTGFYDDAGKLLGVWHFTKNASLEPGDSKTFAVHMRELPVDGLAEKTALIKTFGVGF